jgi:hypothetical protein
MEEKDEKIKNLIKIIEEYQLVESNLKEGKFKKK